ncbi:Hypp6101 [Branchiostoma lanceolatum]|uniref:Hypp6101 protein n=1 Tax=Branchiostoma lanceolatum TaxID=7740 RepID=A0A8J9YSD0_BRALA|nr:Hypp6101 [Branchiostoma lanceolatum]
MKFFSVLFLAVLSLSCWTADAGRGDTLPRSNYRLAARRGDTAIDYRRGPGWNRGRGDTTAPGSYRSIGRGDTSMSLVSSGVKLARTSVGGGSTRGDMSLFGESRDGPSAGVGGVVGDRRRPSAGRGDTSLPGSFSKNTEEKMSGLRMTNYVNSEGNCVYTLYLPRDVNTSPTCPPMADRDAMWRVQDDLVAQLAAARAQVAKLMSEVNVLESRLLEKERQLASERSDATFDIAP